MMEDKFDIRSLQNRIKEITKESEESSLFSHEFLKCLIERHSLSNIIHEDHEFEDVPDFITEKLVRGEVPTVDQIKLMDVDIQDYLLKDCIWICGMGAISWYSDNLDEYKDIQPSLFEQFLEFPDISAGHYTASFIVTGLTLLMSDIPSQQLIETLTNNFDDSDEQLEKNVVIFNEICHSILRRYQEDLANYKLEK
jgi:hypothetical protein